MRLSRLYTRESLKAGTTFRLQDDAAHYLGKVLRLKMGHQVLLFNATDGEYLAEITAIDKRGIDLQLAEACSRHPETLLPVHIGLGLSRGERMDYAVQKSTELGVTEITPLFTDYSEVKLNTDRADKRTAHWQKVAISASEQCGRCRVPIINAPTNIADWIRIVPPGQGFLLDHTGSSGFSGAQPPGIFLLIGPEGGTSPAEQASALAAGFKAINLGPRVLRTETTPVVALTALQIQWGDL